MSVRATGATVCLLPLIMDPSVEIRKLPPSHVRNLVDLLEYMESWKCLMRIIPKTLKKETYECPLEPGNPCKYNSDHFRRIENAVTSRNKASAILLDEWGTSGRIRPAVGHLLYLLIRAELFRAADYVAVKILNQELPPRPIDGPAALVTAPNIPSVDSSQMDDLLESHSYNNYQNDVTHRNYNRNMQQDYNNVEQNNRNDQVQVQVINAQQNNNNMQQNNLPQIFNNNPQQNPTNSPLPSGSRRTSTTSNETIKRNLDTLQNNAKKQEHITPKIIVTDAPEIELHKFQVPLVVQNPPSPETKRSRSRNNSITNSENATNSNSTNRAVSRSGEEVSDMIKFSRFTVTSSSDSQSSFTPAFSELLGDNSSLKSASSIEHDNSSNETKSTNADKSTNVQKSSKMVTFSDTQISSSETSISRSEYETSQSKVDSSLLPDFEAMNMQSNNTGPNISFLMKESERLTDLESKFQSSPDSGIPAISALMQNQSESYVQMSQSSNLSQSQSDYSMETNQSPSELESFSENRSQSDNVFQSQNSGFLPAVLPNDSLIANSDGSTSTTRKPASPTSSHRKTYNPQTLFEINTQISEPKSSGSSEIPSQLSKLPSSISPSHLSSSPSHLSSSPSNASRPSCHSPLPNLSLITSLPHLNYYDIERATNGFDETPHQSGFKDSLVESSGRFLGKGAFGSVYLALELSNVPIAVKKLFLNNVEVVDVDDTVTKQFRNEVEILSKYKHENLLSLLGYSCDGPTYCLLYEYISGGALSDRLTNVENKLKWEERLDIALGTAKAISYLHTAFDNPLVHRDIKSANILLDCSNRPKLCDFGLIKLVSTSHHTANQTEIFGTSAYMAPEAFRNTITIKIDTFSFGVVLLELLTSLPPLDKNREENADLIIYMQETCEDSIEPLLDKSVGSWVQEDINFADELFTIVNTCLEQNFKIRPPMEQVAKKLQELVSKRIK